MNRAMRRAEAAREKMQHNADRIRKLVDERNVTREQLDQFRILLFAAARAQGRLIVRKADRDALTSDDRIDFYEEKNGDVIINYTGAS